MSHIPHCVNIIGVVFSGPYSIEMNNDVLQLSSYGMILLILDVLDVVQTLQARNSRLGCSPDMGILGPLETGAEQTPGVHQSVKSCSLECFFLSQLWTCHSEILTDYAPKPSKLDLPTEVSVSELVVVQEADLLMLPETSVLMSSEV
eukprot:g32807.t1